MDETLLHPPALDDGHGLPVDGHGPVLHDRNGLQILDRATCLRFLREATFGRIAVTMSALPVILPVNYRLVDDRIVFRTTAGTKLAAAAAESVVAFEVDHVDPVSHAGWSVMVTGTARVVDDPELLERYRAAGVPRWARQGQDRYVAIDTDLVAGRALGDLLGAEHDPDGTLG